MLTALVAGQPSPRAYFYLACSRAALVVTQQVDSSALAAARDALKRAGGKEKFPTDLPYISPRVLDALK